MFLRMIILVLVSDSIFGKDKHIDTSRLRQSKEIVHEKYNKAQEKHLAALPKLSEVINNCSGQAIKNSGCSSCERAKEEARRSMEYKERYLPIAQELAYYTWKLQCLEAVINAAEKKENNNSDIVKMEIALNEALKDIEQDLAEEYTEIVLKVRDSVNKAIKLEDRVLGLEEAQDSIPDYE